MRWYVLAALAALLMGGCVEEDPTTYRITGSFTEDRTGEDIDALVAKAEQHGDVAILESFPEQFVITDLDAGGCQMLAPFLDTRDYVASWEPCVEEPLAP